MITELFKTGERVRILYYIMFRSRFTVVKVSKETKVSKGLVSRYLNFLKDEGLLERSNRTYKLKDTAKTRAIKLLLNLNRIDLEKLDLSWVSSLGIFGSWASGTNTQESDVDIWIKVDQYPSEYQLSQVQKEFMNMTDSEVNMVILTPQKFERIKKTDKPFYNALIRNSIILKGEPLE